MSRFQTDRNRDIAPSAHRPALLVLLRDDARAERLMRDAQSAGFQTVRPEGGESEIGPPEPFAAVLCDRDFARSFGDLERLAKHIRTTYGDDLTLLLLELGADAGELPDEVDDIVPLDSPGETGRAFRRAARVAAERRASRLGNLAARAALTALSHAPEYVTLLDEQGRRIWSSPATGRDFGFDMQSLVGDDYLKPRRRTMAAQAEIIRVFNEALARPGEMILGNSEAIRADGAFRRYETRMINLLDDPEIGAIVVMTHERESTPEATPASIEAGPVSFQALVEQGPLVTFVNSVSPKERIVYASPQSLRMLGLETSDVILPDFDWMGRVHPDDRERVVRESALADAGLEDVTIEYRYRIGGTGEYRWVRSNARRAADVNGQPIWIGILSDIEEDRRSREIAIRHMDEIRLLRNIRQLIALEHELHDLFALTVVAIEQSFAYPVIRLYLLDDDFPALQASAGMAGDDGIHPDHQQLLGRAIRSGSAVMAGHETDDGDSLVAPGAPGSWITAEIAVPLVERERVAGVLVIGGTREQPLHRADLTLAETIAEYLAMAIGRTRLHEEAREIGRSYQAVVERVREVIFHLRTEDLAIVFLNPAWTLRLGYPEGSHLGQSLLDVVFPDDRARLEASLKSLATNAIGALMTETRVLTADGEVVWMELRARSDIRSIDEPEITGMLVDITERRKYEEALLQSNDLFRSLAFHDPLTGLPNRLVFNDRLEHALAVSGRRGTGVAVLFLDLDGFKPVNDRYGHAAGDRALEIVGARFAEIVRDGDTIARLGGDEFGIVLEDLDNDAEAKRVAAQVIELMHTPIDLGHAKVTVGVSIGIAYIAGRTITVAEALAEADTALYRAKRSGGGRFSGG